MTVIFTYKSNNSIIPDKSSTKIPDNEIIRDIHIRPNEIAIITTEVIDENNTQTHVYLYKQDIPGYVNMEVRAP